MEKECQGCHKSKPFTAFHESKEIFYESTGTRQVLVHKSSICKECYDNQGMFYRRAFDKRALLMFNAMQNRLRRDPAYAHRKCTFTRQEFLNWVLNDDGYKDVYYEWQASGFLYSNVPSVDRIDITPGLK